MRTLKQLHDDLNGLTDKDTTHSYIETYAKLFEPYREKAVTVFEIGVQHGGSIALWASYFQNLDASIWGADIEDTRKTNSVWDDPRVTFVLRHYADIPNNWFTPERPPHCGGIDILIDDGMHFLSQQLHAFQKFWPLINPGGIYVVEDMQSDGDCDEMMKVFPFEKIDLRHVKGRYDDVLLVARKPL